MSATATRSYHHGNLRSALLAAAEQTLADGGVQALSLRELARELGVSHAAPRRHFADKQALLDALAETGFDRLGSELDEAIAQGGDFRGRLAKLAQAYVRFATRDAALLELMFAGKYRPGAAAGLREAADRAFAAPFQLIADGQAAGDVVGGDVERVAIVVGATFQGLAVMANQGLLRDAPPEAVVAEAVDRLVLGLRPR